MKKLITFLLILSFGFIQAQNKLTSTNFKKGIQKGVTVVEFNAPFNSNNSFSGYKKLAHCDYYQVCIAGNPELKKKYRVYSVPTIIIFHNGYMERKYKGNIMLELDVTTNELQKAVDELYLDKF